MNLTELAVKTVYWFFLYGFIGWGVEVVYAAVKTHKLVNRGFLCGPICPIYGFGMVGLIYSVSLIPMPDSSSMSAVAIFFIGMILTTASSWSAAGHCSKSTTSAGGTTPT